MYSLLSQRLTIFAIVVFAVLATNVAVADSGTAQRYFDDGNSAFRRGDFESALGNYSDAMAHGKEGSRLFYNMGLAHYHLGQYPQAKLAFEESSKDDELAALSYYQLGVLARRSGDTAQAKYWFVRSHDTAHSSTLRNQSHKALRVIGRSEPSLQYNASAGFGFDSNAFRAPDEPYLDITQIIPTPVIPNPRSGVFVPIRASAEYSKSVSDELKLLTSYRFRGHYYADSALENANISSHRFKARGERKIYDTESSSRRIGFEAIYKIHSETNFDRDDGLDRFDDGESIADRYNYKSLGFGGNMRSRIGTTRYEINGAWESRDYDDLPTASSYDMTTFRIGGEVKFPVSETSRLKFGYQYYIRDYDERRSRDSLGSASSANPPIKYQYNILEASIRNRFSDRFMTEIIYSFTLRSDDFASYNDYTRNKIRLETSFDLTDRFQIEIMASYRDQNYSNAFAFDDPTQPTKEYQELAFDFEAEYRLSERLSIQINYGQEAVESSDPRGQYDRVRTSIGAFWQF